MKGLLFIFTIIFCSANCFAQDAVPEIVLFPSAQKYDSSRVFGPLDRLTVVNAVGSTIQVKDGNGRVYVDQIVTPDFSFYVGGALGKHTITLQNKNKRTNSTLSFNVDAYTQIEDDGRYAEMFRLFKSGMDTDTGSVKWNGKRYRYFVPWGLDHFHTMKGLKYILPYGGEFVDLMEAAQRPDGMIYSFVQYQSNVDYFRTRDSVSKYTKKIGDKYFIRQPTENHPEYIYVNSIYQWWKASGDHGWMKRKLASGAKALDYTMNDPARWSKRFQLLKRVYTIDSWDFQVEDEYLPDIGITNSMIIDPDKSKFGVFFGDNTGYIKACKEMAEMYAFAGDVAKSKFYEERAATLQTRLDALAWNGKFYTHFVEEDPKVVRNLGVDEKSQLAQSNAYSLNRGLTQSQRKAIIESYKDLKSKLPQGSPGEWYAIYPPFERGFERHGAKWQYMNGGVGGHVAGELAKGAMESGYEIYGVDVLERLFDLGKKHNNKIYFSYTGAIAPAPPKPKFRSLDLSTTANMDHWTTGGKNSFPWMLSKREGDDLRDLPTGKRFFDNVEFTVIDPAKNNRRSVVAVSRRSGFPQSTAIVVNDTASSVYLMHTSTKPSSENVSGAVSFEYADGSRAVSYILMGKHLTYWWFSELKTDHSGIAWYGSNKVSKGVGVSWCAIDNPNPSKKIASITLHAPQDDGIYTVFAISLGDRPHYVPVSPISFGGPDNWAAATAFSALIEGLAGVKDSGNTVSFDKPVLSPRWAASKAHEVDVTVRYPASNGYLTYRLSHNEKEKSLTMRITGSASNINYHVLLPEGKRPTSVLINGKPVKFDVNKIEQSAYADFSAPLQGAGEVKISYE